MRALDLDFASKHAEIDILDEAPQESLTVPDPGIRHYSIFGGEKKRRACKYIRIRNVFLSYADTFRYKSDWAIYSGDESHVLLMGDQAPRLHENRLHIDRLLFLEDRFTKFNVCHFLFDKLGRALEMRERIGGASKVFVAKHNSYTEFFLNICGLRNVYCGAGATFFVRELYISSDSWIFNHPGRMISETIKLGLRRIANQISPSSGERRLFLTRRNELFRHILNEDELVRAVESVGLMVVNPGQLLPIEQVSLFAGADCVAGVHGAGLTGIAFAHQPLRVVEIVPPLCATPAYQIVASRFNHEYSPVLADDPNGLVPDLETWQHNPGEYNRRDVVVNIEAVLASIRK